MYRGGNALDFILHSFEGHSPGHASNQAWQPISEINVVDGDPLALRKKKTHRIKHS